MFGLRIGAITAGKVGYLVSCLVAAVVLVASGYAHKVVSLVRATGQGFEIKNSPSVGAMNILVMGLESRTDYQGQCLSPELLTAMHAGKYQSCVDHQVGAQDTNTLILIHIFAGGQKAVGFSIPRDSLVQFPQAYLGYSEGKIDAAYNWAYTQYIDGHYGKERHSDLYLHANQAGQQATTDTVQAVTGQHIDHFVEVNLAGFYYLARAFNGIEVCIKPAPAQGGFKAGANLTDYDPLAYPRPTDNSGFSAYKDGYNARKGGAQYLHLSAPQALAYVRSRDTLPGVDIGRTYRQQAVIDYAIWKLKHEGAFNDLSTLNALLADANKYLITDSDWNLLDFVTDMRALTGANMSFTTLKGIPVNNVTVSGYGSPQDIYQVNVPYIRRLIKAAFSSPSPSSPSAAGKATATTAKGAKNKGTSILPASAVTVDVYNGNPNAAGLAAKEPADLVALGYQAGAVKNSSAQTQTVQPQTQVFYGAGAKANAEQIATRFGTSAKALSSLPAHHVEVLIGSTATAPPAGRTPSRTPSAATQSVSAGLLGTRAATGAKHAAASDGLGGGAVTVAPNAPYGIPCVN